MKELYNEFFLIPTNGKIREKVMLTRIITSIAIVVMCLAAMSITAYAYFSHDITSGISTVQAAKFEAKVSINDGAVAVTKAGKTQTATLPAGPNTIKLSKGTSTAKTGFCIVTINSQIKYYTSQIGTDAARNITDASVTFTLVVSKDTTIEILSHWGTCSVYATEKAAMYIADGDVINLATSEEEKNETPEKNPSTEITPEKDETTASPTTTTKKPETTETPTVSTTTKVPETTTAPPTTATDPKTETDSDTSNTPSSTTDSSDTDTATESKAETDGDASKSSAQDAEPSATT